MRPYGCLIQDPPTHISELIDATSSTWDRQRLQEGSFSFDISVIMGIAICTMNKEGAWKSLWKIQVPGKIILFLWRLSKQSLLTEDARAHRHMSSLSSCGLCGSSDSCRHSLLECTTSRCSWALVDEELGQRLVAATEPNAKQWLFSLLETLSHEQFVKMAVTLWAIWSSLGVRLSMKESSKHYAGSFRISQQKNAGSFRSAREYTSSTSKGAPIGKS